MDSAAPSDIQPAGYWIAPESVVQTLDHCRVQERREDSSMYYSVVTLMSPRKLSLACRMYPARFELQMQTLLVARSTCKTLSVEIVCSAIRLDGVPMLCDVFHCHHPFRRTPRLSVR